MVKRFLKLIHREVSGLHQAAYLLGFFTLLSQIIALVRDRLLAGSFGASHTLDLYYAAFRIPDIIFVSIASLVSLSILVPFLIERIEEGNESARRFIDTIFTFFFAIMLITSAVAFLLAPSLLSFLFPPLMESSGDNLILLTRIILLQPIFLGLSNLMASITQVHRRFFIYALSPVLYNFGIILGIVLFYESFGIEGLAWGVVAGSVLHLAVHLPFARGKGLVPRIRLSGKFSHIRKVVATSLPRTFTLASNQIALLVLLSIASFIAEGSISIFNLSFNLQSVPLAVVGVSYSLAAFPTLARLYSKGNTKEYLHHIYTAARHIIFWSIPIMVLFIVLRAQIVRTVLGTGNFGWTDTRLVAAALAMFTFSICAQGLVLLFVRAYYSAGNTKKPLLINISSSALIIILAFALTRFFEGSALFRFFIEDLFRVADSGGATAVLMLPMAFSVGLIINAALLWYSFQRDFPDFSRKLLHSLSQVFASSVIVGYVAHLSLAYFADSLNLETGLGIFLQGLLAGVAGIFAGIVVLRMLGNQEICEVWQTLHRKIWRTKIMGRDPTEGNS